MSSMKFVCYGCCQDSADGRWWSNGRMKDDYEATHQRGPREDLLNNNSGTQASKQVNK